jgi:hypothetical protein
MEMNKTATDKALNASDPIGAIASGVFVILSTLGLAEKWGLSADQLLGLMGALGMVATGARGWLERGRRIRVAELLERHAASPKSDTGDRGDDEADGDELGE